MTCLMAAEKRRRLRNKIVGADPGVRWHLAAMTRSVQVLGAQDGWAVLLQLPKPASRALMMAWGRRQAQGL